MNQVQDNERLFTAIDKVRALETEVVNAGFGKRAEPRTRLEEAYKELREAWENSK